LLAQNAINQITSSYASFDADSAPIGVDNRCTACISHSLQDFTSPPIPSAKSIIGFGGTQTKGIKVGTVKWSWADDNGQVHDHIIPNTYYVPTSGIRLLSPQHWMQTLPDDLKTTSSCQTTSDNVTLQWGQYSRTIPLAGNNVATFNLAPGFSKFHAFCAEITDNIYTYDNNPICLSNQIPAPPVPVRTTPLLATFDFDDHLKTMIQEELQREQDLGPSALAPTHSSSEAEFLHYHYKYGHVSPKRIQALARQGVLPRRLATCNIPICTACLYGKATKRPWRSKPAKDHVPPTHPGQPGDCVSVDMLSADIPGLIAQLTGIPTYRRYLHAAVYVDQATGYGFVWLQKSVSEEETLEGKLAFERHCRLFNVTVKHYHADNGIFSKNAWTQSCIQERQSLTLAGVSAHHQNGVAERRIRELRALARTMLIHAQRRWPQAITTNLWPYAIRMANDVLNATPNLQHKTKEPAELLFSGSTITSNPKHWHHFGCPAYVLAQPLQASQNIYHKWRERAVLGIYLGKSPQHSKEVALVLNLTTGLVSPQFHVKLDSTFKSLEEQGLEVPTSLWQTKCGFRVDSTPRRMEPVVEQQPRIIPGTDTQHDTTNEQVPEASAHSEGDQSQATPQEEPPLRRSTRIRKPVDRLTYAWYSEIISDIPGEIMCLSAMYPDEGITEDPLLALAASSDPDIMYYHQAMREPDKKQFIKAMVQEVEGQIKNNNFSIIERSQVPQGTKVLPAVWAMRRKRRIATGEVYKWKARLNIDGSKQIHGQDYNETYAPVATWASIRLMLIHSIINKWHTRQIDYVQAYTQADIEKDTYMEIPKGFEAEKEGDFVLKVHKNIYGQKQAGLVWNKHLVERLKRVGFKQCETDPCVFVKGSIMYVLYTDDSILMGPDPEELDKLIQEMKDCGLDLTVEGDISDFLGVKIDYKSDGTIHLTQPQLINSILKELHLNRPDTKGKTTPAASSKILSRHQGSKDFDGHFHYRRVIGKLNYLEKSTRPEIAYAVHQCARFTANPKEEHGNALKWLGRYLFATKDRGLILKPSGDSFDVYVDSSFAGDWFPEGAMDDVDTARSRYGYIVMYQGCPITWASKMQTEVALSSTESEYIGLSHTLRNVIPLIELMKELQGLHEGFMKKHPRVHCKLFEDNSGAIELAKVPKIRPRTKHINIKYHHFRQYVATEQVEILKIDTKDQPADMLTKPVDQSTLEKHRLMVMGW